MKDISSQLTKYCPDVFPASPMALTPASTKFAATLKLKTVVAKEVIESNHKVLMT
jgi:hypothetical protein